MTSLPAQINRRLATYFKYHVTANIKITPPPSNPKEATHLYENFKTIANLEHFSIARDKSGLIPYDSQIKVVYNPSHQRSLLSVREDLYRGEMREELGEPETEAELKANQQRIIDKLGTLIALPRFSYIENDAKYFGGLEEIQFKHQLPLDALKYEKQYTITSSTVDSQFLIVKPEQGFDNIDELRRKVRHNFQKFHKFDSIRCWKGQESYMTGKGRKVDDIGGLIDYEKLIVLE